MIMASVNENKDKSKKSADEEHATDWEQSYIEDQFKAQDDHKHIKKKKGKEEYPDGFFTSEHPESEKKLF